MDKLNVVSDINTVTREITLRINNAYYPDVNKTWLHIHQHRSYTSTSISQSLYKYPQRLRYSSINKIYVSKLIV